MAVRITSIFIFFFLKQILVKYYFTKGISLWINILIVLSCLSCIASILSPPFPFEIENPKALTEFLYYLPNTIFYLYKATFLITGLKIVINGTNNRIRYIGYLLICFIVIGLIFKLIIDYTRPDSYGSGDDSLSIIFRHQKILFLNQLVLYILEITCFVSILFILLRLIISFQNEYSQKKYSGQPDVRHCGKIAAVIFIILTVITKCLYIANVIESEPIESLLDLFVSISYICLLYYFMRVVSFTYPSITKALKLLLIIVAIEYIMSFYIIKAYVPFPDLKFTTTSIHPVLLSIVLFGVLLITTYAYFLSGYRLTKTNNLSETGYLFIMYIIIILSETIIYFFDLEIISRNTMTIAKGVCSILTAASMLHYFRLEDTDDITSK